MKNSDMLDVYTDYLITSFSHTTATGLSAMLDGQVSHDKVTRFLWFIRKIRPFLVGSAKNTGIYDVNEPFIPRFWSTYGL